jgi:hypothetical protein
MAGMASTYLRVGVPNWLGEQYSPDRLIPGGGQVTNSVFPAFDAVRVTSPAGAAASATTIPVSAILLQSDGSPLAVGQVAIPVGALIDFGGTKIAVVTANVLRGATSIAVRSLPAAIAANDVGTYLGVGKRTVPSGTLVGRTLAERDAGGRFEPWTAGDEDVFLTFWDADLSAVGSDEVALLRPNTIVKENYIPGFAAMSAPMKAVVRARYQCIVGSPANANPNI